MSQPVLELLLDTNSFSPEKLATLNKFIAVFEKMEKFDKLKVSPISGAGITTLNKKLKETEQLLSDIEKRMAEVKQGADGSFSVTSVTNYNKTVRETAAAKTSATAATNANTAATNTNTTAQKNNSQAIGGVLTGINKMWSAVRILAYILPGIGIAGLFTLAFEGITKAWNRLTDFNYQLRLLSEQQTQYNEDLLKQIKSYEDLYDSKKKLYDLDNQQSEKNRKNAENVQKAGGIDPVTGGVTTVTNAAMSFDEAKKIVDEKKGLKQISAEIENARLRRANLGKELTALNDVKNLEALTIVSEMGFDSKSRLQPGKEGVPDALATAGGKKEFVSKILGGWLVKGNEDTKKNVVKTDMFQTVRFSDEQMKKAEDSVKGKIALEKETEETLLKVYETYTGKKFELDKETAAQNKRKADDDRNSFIAIEKEKQQTIILTNQLKVKDQKSTDEEILKAEENMAEAKNRISYLDRYSITGNSSSTPGAVASAKEREVEQNKRTNEELADTLARLKEDFRQRDLDTKLKHDKAILDADAETNQRLFNNTDESLQDRLDAYNKYIALKIAEQELEYKRDIDVLGMHEDKKIELLVAKNSEVVKIKANVEKEVYQIVQTSQAKILKDITVQNSLQEDRQKDVYVQELAELNTAFANKEISYNLYHERVKMLKSRFVTQSADMDIKNDIQSIANLKNLLIKQKDEKAGYQDSMLTASNPKDKSKFASQANAMDVSISETGLAIKTAQDKLNNDQAKNEEEKSKQLEEGQKQLADNEVKIMQNSLDLAKTFIDERVNYELEKLEYLKDQRNQLADAEIASIEKSSLSAKDKNALEIQLNQKKLEDDKNTALAERQLKRDQAVQNRALAIAEITIDTEVGIMKALKIPGIGIALAASIGVLGALAIAKVVATPLPSFAEGVIGFEGGMARYGEAGAEIVKEPYKSPYLVMSETISYLPKGTDIIPIKDNQIFDKTDGGWNQVKWLAAQMKKANKGDTKVSVVINSNESFNIRKKQILGN